MNGYSDDINHAFAFATKYRAPYAPVEGAMSFTAHPANVAVILARHGADEVTLVAGILHHVLEVTPRSNQLGDRRHDRGQVRRRRAHPGARSGRARPKTSASARSRWMQRKRELLNQLLVMTPRALDICCADEIHQCGTALAIVERLGSEYLAPNGLPATSAELCCYDDILAALDRRTDWHARGMKTELHGLKTRLEVALAADQ